MQNPSVGRMVHYVAYGTPNGEFPSGTCRAAVITEVDDMEQWSNPKAYSIGICVMNPTGLFFNRHIEYSEENKSGTWHYPERVE